jgi:3-deoxy-manno-octulosonate cytidylyltransferase (CMP-KDO synthetase)
MNIAIIIPARFASTRFPGKPLALIDGETMVSRVYQKAVEAAKDLRNVQICVATDDDRIKSHCIEKNMNFVMTPSTCATGSDRTMQAALQLDPKPDFIVNLQGDAPFTPARFIRSIIEDFAGSPNIDVVTPVARMKWTELDKAREEKKTTPFSGTSAVLDKNRKALWFSKNIIPAIRDEEKLRAASDTSPVYRHIGLYGYSFSALQKFITLPQGENEKVEGLEQLRFLENGMHIRAVIVEYGDELALSGIDSPEDLARAEALLKSKAA